MSAWQAAAGVQDTLADTVALMSTVAATTPSGRHPVPGSVRSFVHSACRQFTRPSGGA